jgi:hypothetical protein
MTTETAALEDLPVPAREVTALSSPAAAARRAPRPRAVKADWPAPPLAAGAPHRGRHGSGLIHRTELIMADHGRIERLFGALDDISRYARGPSAARSIGQAWTRIGDLLVAHAEAEEEVSVLVMLERPQDGPADDEKERSGARQLMASLARVRTAAAVAGLHQPGLQDWWRAVHNARLASSEHSVIAAGSHLAAWLGDRRATGHPQ